LSFALVAIAAMLGLGGTSMDGKDFSLIFGTLFHTVSLIGVSAMVLFLFGRENSIVEGWPRYRAMWIKAALYLVAGGHALGLMSFAPVSFPEMVLVGGLALLWCWVALFHFHTFSERGAYTDGDLE
jgi:hypothetical protein